MLRLADGPVAIICGEARGNLPHFLLLGQVLRRKDGQCHLLVTSGATADGFFSIVRLTLRPLADAGASCCLADFWFCRLTVGLLCL